MRREVCFECGGLVQNDGRCECFQQSKGTNTMSEQPLDSISEYLSLVEQVQNLEVLLEGGEDVAKYYNEAIDRLKAYKAENGISNDRVTLYHSRKV
jgi:hypothetical protein